MVAHFLAEPKQPDSSVAMRASPQTIWPIRIMRVVRTIDRRPEDHSDRGSRRRSDHHLAREVHHAIEIRGLCTRCFTYQGCVKRVHGVRTEIYDMSDTHLLKRGGDTRRHPDVFHEGRPP